MLVTDSFVWQPLWKFARQAVGMQAVLEDKSIDVMDPSPMVDAGGCPIIWRITQY